MSEKNKLKDAFKQIKASLSYFVDARRGKISLESYTEIIGEFTDSVIHDEGAKGNSFLGGSCEVRVDPQNNKNILFAVTMFFEGINGDKQKHATRSLGQEKFTREAIERIKSAEYLSYDIVRPQER